MTLNISVIIPTLNEEQTLGRLLVSLQKYQGPEIIVADGESSDLTIDIARYYGAKTVRCEPGRGRQLLKGAAAAGGDVLLFLHCDTYLPDNFPNYVSLLLNVPGTAAGAFRLRIDAEGPGYRLVEWGANMRSTVFQLPYGDQALFLRTGLFWAAGGFRDQSILEDIDLVRRLKRFGKIRLAPEAVITSARRWRKRGLFKTTLLNQVILYAYLTGIAPEKLKKLYYKKISS